MKTHLRQHLLNILNGMAIGIIVTLIPGAILNSIIKPLLPTFPALTVVLGFTAMAAMILPAASATCVGMLSHFTPMQSAALALAATVGAGNAKFSNGNLLINGSGNVLNIGITIGIAYCLILLIGTRLKDLSILLLPTIVLLVGGGIGRLTLGPVDFFTKEIGIGIVQLTSLQPVLMGCLIAICFALIIVSPISSVGIATAIGISGIAAGAANLGIVATAFTLAVAGSQVNSMGTIISHIIGTPKIQMANILAKPKLVVPAVINAGILGGLGAIFDVKGTPVSAGFGLAGLVGPLADLDAHPHISLTHTIVIVSLFLIVPLLLAFISRYLFINKLHFHEPEDLKLDYH
ncbi:Membrane protein [Fructilactobacillus florum 8D]|uniref:Membrane protein n=2 Tax=Fructilactobacillus florum TaxID=640331 RepID=W9EFQ0_9LACO|nr:PTS sugar transporter subunit IIC [Fructilactobacillus florum]EKK20738.1 Membrane protein [Fructilactobacillus florum 2F]ETO40948.1 Membrane protein [Fructilactobacillus florum 8D]KRM91170.1 membrane protein, putative toxin regulator [Fructilactobacillus florum DSM 22689 = JCM 16035]